MEGMRGKVMKNLMWAVGGKVITLLGGLLVGIVIARYLGPKDYGVMNYVISYVFLFQTLALFGLDGIEVREEARGDKPFTTIIGTAFCLKLILGLVAVALCVGTSLFMEADTTTTVYVAVYSCSILAQSFSVIRNYFMAIVQNEYVVKSEISRTLFGVCIKLVMLYFDLSLGWFIVASMFDWVLLASGYIVSYRTKVGRLSDWHFDGRYAKHLLHESYPLLLTNAAVIIYQRIDQVMIGKMIDDKAELGYFSTAARFVEVLVYVPMMLAQTISPVLVKIRKEQGEDIYVKRAQQFMNISLWTSLLASVVVSVLAYWIILFTFGEKYLPAVAVLQLLAFKAASVALSNTAGSMIVIEGLQKWVFVRDLFGCVVCVSLNWYLLPRYGIMASAFVAIMSNLMAGYVVDALVPSFRHLFVRQTKAMLLGWKDLFTVREFVSIRKSK